MGSLPLKIRLDLRDQWESVDSPVQKSISELRDLIGLPVNILLETSPLWAELQRYFPDQATFIPSIADLIKTWVECLTARLEEETYAQWTDRLLDEIKDGGQVLKVRLSTRPDSQVGTAWEKSASTFTIFVTQSSPPYQATRACFTSDFDQLFSSTASGTTETELIEKTNAADAGRWSGVNVASKPPSRLPEYASNANQGNAKSLPSLDTLHRPDILFPRQAPYHMTIRSGRTTITVQGSHQPSLELLANYLKKWINTRMVDVRKVPALQVELQESHFGFGTFFDSFIIKPVDERQTVLNVNPILVIAFIEGVLGYELMPQSKGIDEWYFRRVENLL